MTAWDGMDPTLFDRTLGTAKQRRLVREAPGTLFPGLAPQLTPRARTRWADDLSPAPPVLPGQAGLFGEGSEELPAIIATFTVPAEGRGCSGCREDIPAGATACEDASGWTWCARCAGSAN